MAQTTLVTKEIDEGRELIKSLLTDGFDVSVALWLKTSEEDNWHLYIASGSIDQLGFSGAYQAVDEALRKTRATSIELFDIRLIEANNALAKEVMVQQSKWRAPIDTVFRGSSLGATTVDEALIYAPAAAS